MLILPKYKEIEVPTIVTPKVGMTGEFKCILRDEMGNIVLETPWDRNTILDQGMNLVATQGVFSRAAIGSSNAPVTEVQTNLQALLASNADDISSVNGQNAGTPFEFWTTKGYRFGAGVGTGTIQEMGVHIFNNAGVGGLYCRHIVSPGIVKASDQTLDIYYKHTLYPPLGQIITNNVLVDGVNYTRTLQGASYGVNVANGSMGIMGEYTAAGSSYRRHYSGDISANNEGLPTGDNTTDYGTTSKETYIADSHYVDETTVAGLNDANVTGGILRSSTFPFNGGALQVMYDATDGPAVGTGLPKDGTKLLNFTFRQGWARQP